MVFVDSFGVCSRTLKGLLGSVSGLRGCRLGLSSRRRLVGIGSRLHGNGGDVPIVEGQIMEREVVVLTSVVMDYVALWRIAIRRQLKRP